MVIGEDCSVGRYGTAKATWSAGARFHGGHACEAFEAWQRFQALPAKVKPRKSRRVRRWFRCQPTLQVFQSLAFLLLISTLDDHPSEPVRAMAKRKTWVKRPGSSPTQVIVGSDDLVDDVRDVILRKYANSLGRSFDSPDVILKIVTREPGNSNASNERTLGPDEHMGNTLDAAYPAGQTIDEALIIDVPKKRTPRPSPMVGHHMPYYLTEELRPEEGAGEYFPTHAGHGVSAFEPCHTWKQSTSPVALHGCPYDRSTSCSSLTGQPDTSPSRSAEVRSATYLFSYNSPFHSIERESSRFVHRPASCAVTRLMQPLLNIESKQTMNMNGTTAPPAPPIPTPPLQTQNQHKPSITSPNRSSSPRPGQKSKKSKKSATTPVSATNPVNSDPPPPKPASAGLLDGTVPPINVLIVEDNVINLKLLEQFMRRLRVRWKTAMNGQEAVNQWRTGGFHLVLMDIQLPVMNGLEATREIRRLEA